MAQEAATDSLPLLQTMAKVSNWTGNVLITVGDAAIVWRAWGLWMNSKPVRYTLFIFMLADIGICLTDAAADTQDGILNNAVTLDWVFFVMSLSVNVLATTLIAYRAWTYHKSIQETTARPRKHKTQVERILLLLVESGAIFAVFQIVAVTFDELAVTIQIASPVDIAALYFGNIYTYASAFNPVAIFVLVNTQNTYQDSVQIEETPTLSQTTEPQVVDAGNAMEESPVGQVRHRVLPEGGEEGNNSH